MAKRYSRPKEEMLNTISHAIGALWAIFAMFILLGNNSGKSPYATFSIILYSITLIAMFTVSTFYHAVQDVRLKRRLRILDHINIYFLIAGTYTPVALITLLHGKGWAIFFIVWAIATFGTLFKIFYTGKYEFLSLLLYLAMGWLIVFDFENLMDYTSPLAFRFLFLGGAFYTFGVLFYVWERIPYNHFIWHLFVLGGAVSHWLMIYHIV